MLSSRHRFPDKVDKALTRYREETLRQKLIADAAAAAALEDAALDGGSRNSGGTTQEIWRSPDETPPRVGEMASVPVAPLVSPAEGYLAPCIRPDQPTREARRRKAYRWLLVLTLLPLTGWIATRPVNTEKVLMTSIVSYGDRILVPSPIDGTIRRLRSEKDFHVARGEPLIEIEPEVLPELTRAQREWVTLRLRELAIKASLDGESDIAYPIELANAFPNVDVGPLLERERERLRDNEREAAELLGVVQQSIDSETAKLTNVWAQKLTVEKRLTSIRARLGRARALLDQNVVFEDGVYTEQLIKTLRASERSANREFAALSEQEEQTNERLHELEDKLAKRKEDYRARQRRQLEKNRSDADQALAALEDLRMQAAAVVEIKSKHSGWFEPNARIAEGLRVSQGDPVGLMRVPSETATLESRLPSHEAEQVTVGQAAKVTLSNMKRSEEYRFDGRVTSILSNAAGSVESEGEWPRLRIEIDVPQNRAQESELKNGMPGRVRLDTDGEMLSRWIWRGLVGLVDEWDPAQLVRRSWGATASQAAESNSAEGIGP